MKNRLLIFFFAIALTVIAIFICAENRPQVVISSSVYNGFEQTEINMYVLINTFLNIDKDKISEEIISEHQKVNGIQNNMIYTLHLYRTMFHYRRNWEYDTIICDEKGAIICCKEDLGV